MARQRHLDRAPITEALIDIRVKSRTGASIEDVRPFFDRVKDEFTRVRTRRSFTGRISLNPTQPAQVETVQDEIEGYLAESRDGISVVQASTGGFTFSRLRPYESWEALRDRAKELWSIYQEVVAPSTVERIAVRYINRIEIPAGEDFSTYFRTTFVVAPELPQAVSNFLLRIQLPFPSENALAIVTQTVSQPSTPGRVPYIFDIDVFRTNSTGDTESIWRQLEELRVIKNRIFFDGVSEKALEGMQ